MELGNSSTAASDTDEFGYCDADGGSVTGQYYQACLNCLSASGGTNFVANGEYLVRTRGQGTLIDMTIALVALGAGCTQRPNTTDALGLNGSVFSSSVIEIVDPSTSSESGNAAPLGTVAIAGIAVGGCALVAIIAAIAFVRCRRRKNRTGILRKPRWDKSHKRRSSFSFKCRNILASPLSPKFFRDLDPVEEQHEPYGSLDAQMTGGPPGRAGDSGRYYIETKPRLERHPYETSLEGWHSQEIGVPDQHPAIVPDRWNTYGAPPEKKGISRKGPMTIDTTEAALAPPPPTHPSPRANSFGISPSASSTSSLPQQHHKTSPISGSSYYYSPEDLYRVASVTTNANNNTIAPNTTVSPSRGPAKQKTTTMSSQGSGYPSLHGQGSSSPLMRQQRHGPPGARENAPEPWFPPPPSSSEGPRLGSSSSAAAPKFGMRKVSPGTMRRGKRESGSPVESKQIQVSFPGPPQR